MTVLTDSPPSPFLKMRLNRKQADERQEQAARMAKLQAITDQLPEGVRGAAAQALQQAMANGIGATFVRIGPDGAEAEPASPAHDPKKAH